MAPVRNAAKITHRTAMKLNVMHWMDIASKMADAKNATKITHRTAMKLNVMHWMGIIIMKFMNYACLVLRLITMVVTRKNHA